MKRLFILVLIATIVCVYARDAVHQAWLDAYMVMTEATQCWERDDFKKAEELFAKAIVKFEKLREEHPEWNRELVAFRLAYCRLKQREMTERNSSPLDNLTREQLLEEILRLRRLEDTQASAAKQEKEIADTAEIMKKNEELETLRDTLSDSERKLKEQKLQIALLEKKAKAGERDHEALQTLRKRFEEILVERDDAKEKLSEAEKTLKANKISMEELRAAAEAAQEMRGEKRTMRKAIRELEAKKDILGVAKYWSAMAGGESGDTELAMRAAYWNWRCEDKELTQRWLDIMFQRGQELYNAYLTLGCACLDAGQTERALALVQWAVAMSPNNAEANFMLGSIYLAAGENQQAEKKYRRTLTLNPRHADCMVYLAVVLAASGDKGMQEARELYQQALALGHAPEEALEECFRGKSAKLPKTP